MIWLRVHVCSSVSMYDQVYLYVSALFQQTKRAKAIVYSIELAGESLNLMEPQNGYQEIFAHR